MVPRLRLLSAALSLIACLSLSFDSLLFGRSYSPWVVSEHVADWSGNWKSFMQYHEFQGKRDRELAVALWKYLCLPETGLVHTGPWEEPTRLTNEKGEPDGWGNPYTYGSVFDPVKNLNSFAMGYCGMQSSVVAGIFRGLGYESRNVNLDHGYSHEICEVFYEGGWHFIDTDERGVVLTPEGELASWEQMSAHPGWWNKRPFPDAPHFPNHLEQFGGLVSRGKIEVQALKYRWAPAGHTMDFVLRMGESFTRFWRADSTRYYRGWWERNDNAGKWFRENILKKPEHMFTHGQKGEYGSLYDRPGSGVFLYRPQLGNLWQDYADGVYADSGIAQNERGLAPAGGRGWTEFKVYTPYIIVGKNGADPGAEPPHEGVIIAYRGRGGLRVLLSPDFGCRWEPVGEGEQGRIDVTAKVYGKWGYLVRFELAPGAALEEFDLTTWVLAAPVSLPAVQGPTRMQFRTGDRTGARTVVAPFTADFSTTKDSLAALSWLTVKDHDPQDLHHRSEGAAALISPPKGCKLAWLTVGGAFDNTLEPEIWVSTTGNAENLRHFYTLHAPAWCDHWMSNVDELIGPTEKIPGKLLVEYRKNVNNVRIYGHYTEPERPVQDSPVEITHCVGGVETTLTARADTSYTLEGAGENEWIRMRVKSERVGTTQ